MTRKFSLVYLTAAGCAPPEMIHLAARAGFEYVSLRTISMGLAGEPEFGLARNPALLRDTRTALEETDVKLLDIENARIHDATDFARYLPEMEIAASLGATAVLTNVWTADRNLAVDSFARLCEHAKSFGLKVSLEFVTWAAIRNIRESVDLIEAAGCDNAGIAVDLLHFSRSRCTLDELASLPPKLLTALHLCDAPAEIPETVAGLIHNGRAERLYVGEGGIDVAGVVRRMPDIVFGVEIPHLERVKVIGHAEHVFRALERTKDYLAAHSL